MPTIGQTLCQALLPGIQQKEAFKGFTYSAGGRQGEGDCGRKSQWQHREECLQFLAQDLSWILENKKYLFLQREEGVPEGGNDICKTMELRW